MEPFLCTKACLCSQAHSERPLWKTWHQGAVGPFLRDKPHPSWDHVYLWSWRNAEIDHFHNGNFCWQSGLWKLSLENSVNLIKLLTFMGLASGRVWNSFSGPTGSLGELESFRWFLLWAPTCQFHTEDPMLQDSHLHLSLGSFWSGHASKPGVQTHWPSLLTGLVSYC